ncbi:adenosine deaminase [Dactylonectria macrodidyma]|uniref:Adenine deaminase n=1 Tax=Dactylonectria macrodidyma TaxID=307937 RepID=A0A9P9E2Z9_9HYPO|nr:adenosine deaminase [Dactylonectria macrodidyma]
MCKSPLHGFLQALPKVELHMHLEGSLSPELLFELAAKNKVPLPQHDPAFTSPAALSQRYERFSSLEDFLSYFFIGMSTLLHAADFERLAYAYFEKADSQQVKHTEVFFDPQMHISRGVLLSDVVEGFSRARARAKADFGMTTELIMCMVRHLPMESCLDMFQAADAAGLFKDGSLCGIGMDSTELERPATLYEPIYRLAKEQGIRRTMHAGEGDDCPANYVSMALDVGATRIDHGWRSVEEEAILERLVATRTLLTLCPLSNVKVKGIESIEKLPIRTFIERGVKFCINSDDPAYYGGYIQENYCAIQDTFNLTMVEWISITRNAMELSWASEERIQQMLGLLREAVALWR